MDIESKIENLFEHLSFRLSHTLCEMFVIYKLYLKIKSKYQLNEIFSLLGYTDSKRRQFSNKLLKSWNSKEMSEIEKILKNNETPLRAILNLFE